MLSYITEPLRKLFSTRDVDRYNRKRSNTSMTAEFEEDEPASKRFHRSAPDNQVTRSGQPKQSNFTGSIPFGNCIQDWIARISQMAARPVMSINIGHVRDADDFLGDEHEDQEDGDDSDIEIIDPPLQINGKDKSITYSQALTREPLHSVHIANTNGQKQQEDILHDVDEDSDVMILSTSQNGLGSVHHKNVEDEVQSDDSSPQSSEFSLFRKYYGNSKHYLKSKTPLEPVRLGEREQYRMLLEQCKVDSQTDTVLEKSKHLGFQPVSVRQRESLKHGVSVSKLSAGSRKGLIDRLSSDFDWKQKIYKDTTVTTKDSFDVSKYIPSKLEPQHSGSIVGKVHPKQLDSDLSLRNGSIKQPKPHNEQWKKPSPYVSDLYPLGSLVDKVRPKQPEAEIGFRNGSVKQLKSHHDTWDKSLPAQTVESVRPKTASIDRRRSMPSFEKPKFSQAWLNDLQMSLDDCCKYRAQKEEKLEKQAREMRERREAKIFADNRKTLHRLAKTLKLKPTDASEEEEDKSHFPELTPEMERKIDDVLRPTPPEEVLCEGFRLSIARRDMETLSGLNWLNDEIINFYMNLLMERGKNDNFPSVYAFNTFFYPKLISGGHAALRRWTRQVDIFSYHYVLIPVHLGMHWCLAVIDFKQKKIQYYDSMGGQNNECVNALKTYLHDESKDKKKEEYDMSDWKFETVKNIPQQMNGSDCGMFTLKYAEYITRNAKITFSQRHMPYFRRRMVYEILTKNLL